MRGYGVYDGYIRVLNDGAGNFICRTMREEKNVVIETEDTGGCVRSSILSNIFDTFLMSKEKGLGFGAAIAYKIVIQHDGLLTVANNVRGSVFHLTLPRSPISES